MKPFIQENRRISGTRFDVYDIWDYYQDGWRVDEIAFTCRLTKDQVAVAMEYIDAHREEVIKEYEAFKQRKNPPEVQALIDARAPIVRAKMEAVKRQLREARNGAGNPGGCESGRSLRSIGESDSPRFGMEGVLGQSSVDGGIV